MSYIYTQSPSPCDRQLIASRFTPIQGSCATGCQNLVYSNTLGSGYDHPFYSPSFAQQRLHVQQPQQTFYMDAAIDEQMVAAAAAHLPVGGLTQDPRQILHGETLHIPPVHLPVKPVHPSQPIHPPVKPVQPIHPPVKPVQPIHPPVKPVQPIHPPVRPVHPVGPVPVPVPLPPIHKQNAFTHCIQTHLQNGHDVNTAASQCYQSANVVEDQLYELCQNAAKDFHWK